MGVLSEYQNSQKSNRDACRDRFVRQYRIGKHCNDKEGVLIEAKLILMPVRMKFKPNWLKIHLRDFFLVRYSIFRITVCD